uniref:Uncharacterized protein n=1 Tax=Anguilla anguilla TaxID=7936 RepID=A0A0E9TKU2_ANGAN
MPEARPANTPAKHQRGCLTSP